MERFRKHIRLKGFDYSNSHYYFVTICTDFRKRLFETRVSQKYGHLVDSNVVAASYAASSDEKVGKGLTDLVEKKLNQISDYYNADLDFYVIMPDHIHFILGLNFDVVAPSHGAREGRDKSDRKAAQGAATTSLPKIVNAFKSWVSRKAGFRVFQPNYYEHIVRSEEALDGIRNYILQNPYIEYDEINWKLLDPSM